MKHDKPKDACGVFGIVSDKDDVARLTFFGLYALQHRGQESCGIATFNGNSFYVHKDLGLVSQVFDEENLSKLKGEIAVGHTRYSTTGNSTKENAQPIIVEHNGLKIALAHNGNLVNAAELRTTLLSEGFTFQSTTDSEAIAKLIVRELKNGCDLLLAIKKTMNLCEGAFSLVIATNEYLIGVRDKNGIRPFCIGKTSSGSYVLSSESCALDIIGAVYQREISPGEIVFIDKHQNLSSEFYTENVQLNFCVFELIYFSRPDSNFENHSVYNYRKQFGKQLAKESPVNADFVISVPDSGTPAAIGFAEELKIPFTEALIKNRYVGRTFIQPTNILRELGIRLKLNPLKDIIQNKKIVVVDDSIVRGNTSKKIVQLLRESGAKEVHMRLSSPPIKWPCFYGIDIDSKKQLIAATSKSIADIRDFIGADSLEYLSIEGMLKSTQIEGKNFCTACFSGKYPIKVTVENEDSKLKYEKTIV